MKRRRSIALVGLAMVPLFAAAALLLARGEEAVQGGAVVARRYHGPPKIPATAARPWCSSTDGRSILIPGVFGRVELIDTYTGERQSWKLERGSVMWSWHSPQRGWEFLVYTSIFGIVGGQYTHGRIRDGRIELADTFTASVLQACVRGEDLVFLHGGGERHYRIQVRRAWGGESASAPYLMQPTVWGVCASKDRVFFPACESNRRGPRRNVIVEFDPSTMEQRIALELGERMSLQGLSANEDGSRMLLMTDGELLLATRGESGWAMAPVAAAPAKGFEYLPLAADWETSRALVLEVNRAADRGEACLLRFDGGEPFQRRSVDSDDVGLHFLADGRVAVVQTLETLILEPGAFGGGAD